MAELWGVVVIPDGQWTSGRIILKSGARLHLNDGAVLRFSGDIKDYQPAVLTRNEGYDVMSLGAMIYANGAENIGITGRGHIVGPSTDCEMYVKNRDYLVVEQCVDITKPISERLCDGLEGRPVLLWCSALRLPLTCTTSICTTAISRVRSKASA